MAALSPFVLRPSAILNHVRLDLVIVIEDLDTVAAIAGLARFEDPELVRLASSLEGFPIRVQLEVGLGWHQVGFRQVVKDIQAFE